MPALAWHIIKTVFVAAVTFFGAAFSIMAFNNDVDVTKLFGQIYELVTGQETQRIYNTGDHIFCGSRRGHSDILKSFRQESVLLWTPMEIQMRLYENDIQTTLIENSERRGEEIDVGTTDTSGSNRE